MRNDSCHIAVFYSAAAASNPPRGCVSVLELVLGDCLRVRGEFREGRTTSARDLQTPLVAFWPRPNGAQIRPLTNNNSALAVARCLTFAGVFAFDKCLKSDMSSSD